MVKIKYIVIVMNIVINELNRFNNLYKKLEYCNITLQDLRYYINFKSCNSIDYLTKQKINNYYYYILIIWRKYWAIHYFICSFGGDECNDKGVNKEVQQFSKKMNEAGTQFIETKNTVYLDVIFHIINNLIRDIINGSYGIHLTLLKCSDEYNNKTDYETIYEAMEEPHKHKLKLNEEYECELF
jgi:hypothetical protein